MIKNMPVDVNAYHVPGSNSLNYGAAYNHQLRVQEDRARYGNPSQPKVDTYRAHMDHVRNAIVLPQIEAALAAGTARSSASVIFDGRKYTLPSKRTSMINISLKFSEQYGGLHGTDEIYAAIDKSLDNLEAHNDQLLRENSKTEGKGPRKFFKSTKSVEKFALVPEDFIWHQFARKFAESRVPIGVVTITESDGTKKRMLTHPSSESGNFMGEMQAWSDAHWNNIAEVKNRDWTKEVFTSFPRNKII